MANFIHSKGVDEPYFVETWATDSNIICLVINKYIREVMEVECFPRIGFGTTRRLEIPKVVSDWIDKRLAHYNGASHAPSRRI